MLPQRVSTLAKKYKMEENVKKPNQNVPRNKNGQFQTLDIKQKTINLHKKLSMNLPPAKHHKIIYIYKRNRTRTTKQVIKNKIGNTKIRNKKEKIQQENEKRNQYSIKISIKDSQIATNIPTVNQTVSRNKNCQYRTLGIKQDKQNSQTKIKQQRTKQREPRK